MAKFEGIMVARESGVIPSGMKYFFPSIILEVWVGSVADILFEAIMRWWMLEVALTTEKLCF